MYLEKHLSSNFDARTRELGSLIYELGQVKLSSGNQWEVSAEIQDGHPSHVDIIREDDKVRAYCECSYWEAKGICKHIWAVILAADRKSYLLGAVAGLPPRLVDVDGDFDVPVVGNKALRAKAKRNAAPQPRQPARPEKLPAKPPEVPAWRKLLRQLNGASVQTVPAEWRSDRELYYIIEPRTTSLAQGLKFQVEVREQKKPGQWSKLQPLRLSLSRIREIPDALDREILTMLTGASNSYYGYMDQPIPSQSELRHAALEILLPKILATGKCRLRTDPVAPVEELPVLQWDDGDPWHFRLAMDRENDNWVIRGVLERGGQQMDLAEPDFLLQAGFLAARGKLARLDHDNAFSWIALLRKEGKVSAPAEHGPELVSEILQSPWPPEVLWPEDLSVKEVREAPRPVLKLGRPLAAGRQEKFRGQVLFEYPGEVIPFDAHQQGRYRPEERLYIRRDQAAESASLEILRQVGLKQTNPIYGESGPRWEVLTKKLPGVVRALAQAGWQIEADGKAFRRAAAFRAELGSGVDWFELHGAADYGDREIKLPELLKALARGEEMVPLGDGSFGLIPEEFLEKYGLLARLGQAQGDHVRFTSSQAALLDVLLEARPEIKVDEVFARARAELRQFEGIQPVSQPAEFVGDLRGYQCEGLAWMECLRRLGFGGCLADDMGVGKTPQVLAMLEARRQAREQSADQPSASLVVAPRSLIYNWAQEAARFTPRLRVLDHSGAGREKDTTQFSGYDLILTTYGTLRRDIAVLQDHRFDYVILDEAQAIKNAASESAKAARLLRANHRLALSGTPIENHLGELWSLLEFLNPGMLGAASVFQGVSGALRNPDEATRRLLGRALRPFILRRTKAQVIKELPEKLEQTIFCELDATQRKLYNELREHYRHALLGRIEAEGLAKSKMHILEALLRLRQAACHPGLIDKKRTGESSAKLDTLLAQVSEVAEEGHKALVFSQFTSLLAIVRRSLDTSGLPYEYLDGQTKDRQGHVERFQSDPECKLFLISLKAGGVGLNLTAAEYVFLLDPWWNPAVEAQAIDRTHRIGQSQPVFAYRLIARDTVEEKVLELQQSKRALADAIIGEDNRLLGNLKREDLELLLS